MIEQILSHKTVFPIQSSSFLVLFVSDIVSMEIFRGGVIFGATYVFLSLKLVFWPEINSSLLFHGSPVIILWDCGLYARLLGTMNVLTCHESFLVFFLSFCVFCSKKSTVLPLEVIKCVESWGFFFLHWKYFWRNPT